MAFRRKRRPKVVWLPPAAENRLGANPAITGASQGAFDFFVGFGPGAVLVGDTVTGIIPIVSDIPSAAFQGSALAVENLSDIYNSGYRLRRVVGKIFCCCSQTSGAPVGEVPRFLVTAGIIVLRVNQDGTPTQANFSNYNPSIINNWADPWVWRRSWMLDNFAEAIAVDTRAAFPENNVNTGSVMDGPHVDVKTGRVIALEERLFLVTAITAVLSGEAGGATTSQVHFTGELRMVGSLRNMAGNRRNASR